MTGWWKVFVCYLFSFKNVLLTSRNYPVKKAVKKETRVPEVESAVDMDSDFMVPFENFVLYRCNDSSLKRET